ncbi:hypothetical protein PJE062_2420 [Pseudovibrio sp. JE062]|nr:hypothetical protein PJE062_2420 [Pseudovibrio sp. JE062]
MLLRVLLGVWWLGFGGEVLFPLASAVMPSPVGLIFPISQ